jgi:Domain of unknown function (DUF4157)
MNLRSTPQKITSSFTPIQTGLLQRKCNSCGQHSIASGSCTECQKTRSPLQRRAANSTELDEVPPIVLEVLRSPGQPLDADTRAFMEPRFRHDFTQVRVHTDARAAASAQAVNALAYTVGRNVVFGTGQYLSKTPQGEQLLAHELTHVAQQEKNPSTVENTDGVEFGYSNGAAEAEADAIADAILAPQIPLQPIHQTDRQVARQSSTGATAGTTTQAKGAVVRQHEFQQRRIATLIQQGLDTVPLSGVTTDTSTLFHNSCEWIAAGRSKLIVLTRTHDATTRRPGSIAYFDREVSYPAIGGDYAEQPTPGDNNHIEYAPPNWQGGLQANEFSLLDPAFQSDEQLKSTFIHEVQHAADQTFWGRNPSPPPGRVGGSPRLTGGTALISAGLYNNYQSEFRSYWLQAPEGSPQNQFGSSQQPATNTRPVTWTSPSGQRFSSTTSFQNERQERIFWHLATSYTDLKIPETYTQEGAYRNMVDLFSQPMGINLVNSVRIQELTDVLQRCNPSMDRIAPEVREVFNKVNALDSTDRAFLNRFPDAQPFWSLATRVLSLAVVILLRKEIARLPVGDFPPDPSWRLPSDRQFA